MPATKLFPCSLTIAAAILADWKNYVGKFRKVMPHEFRRALGEMQKIAQEQPRLAAGA